MDSKPKDKQLSKLYSLLTSRMKINPPAGGDISGEVFLRRTIPPLHAADPATAVFMDCSRTIRPRPVDLLRSTQPVVVEKHGGIGHDWIGQFLGNPRALTKWSVFVGYRTIGICGLAQGAAKRMLRNLCDRFTARIGATQRRLRRPWRADQGFSKPCLKIKSGKAGTVTL